MYTCTFDQDSQVLVQNLSEVLFTSCHFDAMILIIIFSFTHTLHLQNKLHLDLTLISIILLWMQLQQILVKLNELKSIYPLTQYHKHD